MKILEKASAKINLSLDVLHKRDDGFHEVEMIMTMVDLADRIEIEEQPHDKIRLSKQLNYLKHVMKCAEVSIFTWTSEYQ
jgi:4-diphosphocytidyl-2-C-methyl-D-erythritol kinase